jgi:hypothetical protein
MNSQIQNIMQDAGIVLFITALALFLINLVIIAVKEINKK